MSLRDDLRVLERFLLANHAHAEEWTSYTALSAALSPAALQWLEALPELLKAKAARVIAAKRMSTGETTEREWDVANDRLVSLFDLAIHEAAALHAAASAVNAGTDNKEQK